MRYVEGGGPFVIESMLKDETVNVVLSQFGPMDLDRSLFLRGIEYNPRAVVNVLPLLAIESPPELVRSSPKTTLNSRGKCRTAVIGAHSSISRTGRFVLFTKSVSDASLSIALSIASRSRRRSLVRIVIQVDSLRQFAASWNVISSE